MTKNRRIRSKFELYEASVQAPENDITFIQNTFKALRKRSVYKLREDFCASFALARTWANIGPKYSATAYDLDPKPVSYGVARANAELDTDAIKRLTVKLENVLTPGKQKTEVIAALNFSYFIFKKREVLKSYLRQCLKDLVPDGVLILDAIGGTSCQIPNEFKRRLKGYNYIWDLESYNPIQNNAVFSIHFQERGRPIMKRAFTYDWRLWSIPEIRELLDEVGFKASYVYWEGTDRTGAGNGVFKKTEIGEPCETWIAYIVGVK